MKAIFRRYIARRLEAQVRRLVATKQPKIVAITGSVGKTSTKQAAAHMLSSRYKVQAHPGNYNSEIGLPLAIFEIEVPRQLFNPLAWIKILRLVNQRVQDFSYEVVVLEMGADQPSDIAKFMHYIKPDIGVVTAVQPVHIEQFKTIEAIYKEKSELARRSSKAILNADDARLIKLRDELTIPVTTYGAAGDIHFADQEILPTGIKGGLCLGKRTITVQTQFVGLHSLHAIEAAAAVALELGLSDVEIQKGAETFAPVNGRMKLFPGKNSSLIIDDTYNASPEAGIAAVETLMNLKGRKIAVLGNMNELGDYTEEGHRKVGAACGGLDLLVTIGESAKQYLADSARQAGLADSKIISLISPYDAGNYVQKVLAKGDIVLVKGSQNRVFAEEATKLLLADPADAAKLVRQSPDWLAKKRAQFEDAAN